jgi:biotin-(acetyl-CoA carboxylase) ligase
VVGIGINLRAPDGGYGTDAMARPVALDAWVEPAAQPSPLALAEAVLAALDRELHALVADGPSDVIVRAREAMTVWGRRVHGERDARPVEGIAKDLAHDGGLVVRLDSGTEVVVHAGDVRVTWDEA